MRITMSPRASSSHDNADPINPAEPVIKTIISVPNYIKCKIIRWIIQSKIVERIFYFKVVYQEGDVQVGGVQGAPLFL